jgi:acetyl esterase/lipase
MLDVYAPAARNPFPTVIGFHGGGLTQGERSIPLPLRNQGMALVSATCRLSPGVKSPVCNEDAAAAIAWTFKHIANFGGDPQRIFVSDHGAGAYLTPMCGL